MGTVMKKHSNAYLLILRRLEEYIAAHDLLKAGDCVLLGVSGGADSTALLFLMKEWAKKMPLSLRVVHVHHGLRPSADEDQAFVEAMCKAWGIPCVSRRVEVSAYAKEKGLGTEEAARILRHGVLAEEANAGDEKIALAHHRDDQAETVLFQLARGSSLKGLSGMAPKAGRIIRPLLDLSREEIELLLAENELTCREDETNAQDTYTRNRIRHHILPLLQQEANAQASAHIAEAAEDIAEADAYLQTEAMKLYESAKMPWTDGSGEEDALRIRALTEAPPVLAKRVLLLAIAAASGAAKDIGRVHIEDVYRLLTGAKRGEIALPYGLKAVREYGRLYFRRNP